MTPGSTRTDQERGTAPELLAQWQEEMARNLLRMQNLAAMIMNRDEPAVGPTPREEIYRKNKSRLYRYRSSPKRRTPVLFVPNLGISRPYIFDLLAGGSFVEHMINQGFDFYLLDWGVFGPEDNDLTVDDCVTRILPRMAKKVLESSGTREFSLVGYCMGAPLSACFLALHPEMPVKNLINMAGPIDFSKAGLFRCWLNPKYF
ncbi:MAG TPA: alpha/beta fold hydrolase, partial [archaeon]|nr:alpha/beta fold hydrolase [archaeon]